MIGQTALIDVVVVGAGFAGLAAANQIKAAGVDCLVLEARDRVGGRVEAGSNGLGETVDLGGQFICDDMPEIMALARQHGKTLVRAYTVGAGLVQPIPQNADDLYGRVTAMRDRLNAIEPDDPSIAGLSVAAWTAAQADEKDAKAGFLSMIEGLWCQPPADVPLWYLIGNDRRITNEVPELQYLLKETIHSLAVDLARPLGDAVRLSEPAERIVQDASGITVKTPRGTISARKLIVAVPPVMAGRIAFDPPLPKSLADALGAWRSGRVIKAFVRYKEPFWRERGLSGMVFFLDPAGLYACDASHDDGHAALVVFIGGRIASEWAAGGKSGTAARIVARLSAALGPQAADALDITLRDWSDDRWSGGAYSDIVIDCAASNAEAVLRSGLADISFACSELSPSYPGYIEGALVAGREAAAEVVAQLAGSLPAG
ncbi:MAG: FAD-dependent oxidoreductase [Alphaproteobacteria bacterium]|nr:FAD-dependent oxidoreductase [Alphaproteobacteria bacterium]MBU0805539.1 FAD-dependent oxidoreductase [Alphaproteobacteria bacterium]MBU0873485.1 FAD-dependent oxidoreductase [Alphaproteobacteria bacterium]MBU1401287.1 FAD-dependent oxidoreductase [Alphaproteobacteria bacterium]MBU1592296.1 FAD-dependent oxidoreductase [Alphaproteobacteria bacterium]